MQLDFLKQFIAEPSTPTTPDTDALVQEISAILGDTDTSRAARIFEAVDEQITTDNYDEWLSMVENMARENGAKLTTRSTFDELAFSILDNDSFIDMIRGNNETVKTRIVNALWAMYKQRQSEQRANVALSRETRRQREEEEAVMSMVGTDDFPRDALAPAPTPAAIRVTAVQTPEPSVGTDSVVGGGIGDVDSILRQVISSPTGLVSSAIKQVETEGKEAWAQVNLPTNPHPAGSQAHKAWVKGLVASAKDALGIVDKPSTPSKTKRKPKRK